jgi:predicted Zn-dependent protease
MAHLSPEMTLVYAKLLDSTMHHKWEEAMARAPFAFRWVDSQNESIQKWWQQRMD